MATTVACMIVVIDEQMMYDVSRVVNSMIVADYKKAELEQCLDKMVFVDVNKMLADRIVVSKKIFAYAKEYQS